MSLGMEINLDELEKEEGDNPFVSKFEEFFNNNFKKEIDRLVQAYPDKKSLNIDFNELDQFDYQMGEELIINPDYVLEAAKKAIKNVSIPSLEIEEFIPHIRIYNLPKDHQPLLRDVSSEHINKMLSIEGVIRTITDVLPKLKNATWECRRCGNTYRIPQDGQTIVKPAICECKHKDFTLVPDKSKFIDYQKVQIQEPLEKLRGNDQPTVMDIYVSDDLVNKLAAGDKTRFIGILRLLPPKEKKTVYGRYLEAIHLEETEKEFSKVEIAPEEEEKILELSKEPKIYEKLINSIAPAIYGHELIKEAISLQLFGGVKKNLPNKTKIRGNIHVLVVGDPGLAKSQLLKATDRIAPKSIFVAGKSSSGVGLTASAVKDDFGEGGWTLKAGALVLASGGMAMIDEFDKMDPDDRSAMHEAMEQGSVSIAKAGIVSTFKTDTSILAAANPKYSRFDKYQNFLEQIDLPPTLISRFDLFFALTDVLDRVKDQEIAEHILKTHKAGQILLQRKQAGQSLTEEELNELKQTVTPEIDGELLKKYISYARQKVFPILTDESHKAISEFYINLRDLGRKEGSYAATHRQLEGIIRLSEASARVRLKKFIELEDVERATRLVRKSLEQMVVDPETGKIDIDLVTSKQSHTQMSHMMKLLKFIKDSAKDMGMVPMNTIREFGKEKGIKDDKIDDLVRKLKKKGDLYEPKHSFFKPTGMR